MPYTCLEEGRKQTWEDHLRGKSLPTRSDERASIYRNGDAAELSTVKAIESESERGRERKPTGYRLSLTIHHGRLLSCKEAFVLYLPDRSLTSSQIVAGQAGVPAFLFSMEHMVLHSRSSNLMLLFTFVSAHSAYSFLFHRRTPDFARRTDGEYDESGESD
ncbi:hypothetical protein BC939DRAFT_433839, partial [Gamsiella multidivaricata]|uniref:uncharacterized protein n=1 Tax=Gamsiella multidivaricata TaxID=101098 RepID=UPI00221E91AA